SNGTQWLLFHDVVVAPDHHRERRHSYGEINQRFAGVTAAAAAPEATVQLHDYQLLPVPNLLLRLRPDLPIGQTVRKWTRSRTSSYRCCSVFNLEIEVLSTKISRLTYLLVTGSFTQNY